MEASTSDLLSRMRDPSILRTVSVATASLARLLAVSIIPVRGLASVSAVVTTAGRAWAMVVEALVVEASVVDASVVFGTAGNARGVFLSRVIKR